MNTSDDNSAKPVRSLTTRSKDDKTILHSEVTTPSQLGNNPMPATVSNAEISSFDQKILMSSLNGIYIYDLATGANIFINSQYTRLTGYTFADLQTLKGAEFFGLFHPQDRQRVAVHMEHVGRAGNDETREIEYRFKTAEGRWIWCLSRDAVFERDGRGAVRRIIGTFVDITARKTAEKKLAHERELLQTLIDTIPVMITIYDPGLERFSFNNEFRRVLGWSEQDMGDGDPMEKFYPDKAEREAAQQFMGSLENGWRIFKVTGRDGGVVESSWANIRLSDDTQVGIGIDITDRKRAEADLKKARDDLKTKVRKRTSQLQELSRKSIEALESDRRTTAKELHDGIGASLAAIKFRLESIVEEIVQNPRQAAASLDESISYLQDTIKETKQISANLRPTMLDDLGLLSTIAWYIRQFSQQFDNIQLRSQIEIREEDIPETLKIVIYRVLQESLHNAAKHSEASEVAISLKTDPHQIVLEVVDNGAGFDVQKALGRHDPLSGFGLASMMERAEIAGGSLTIDSAPGKGTRIKMALSQTPYVSGYQ